MIENKISLITLGAVFGNLVGRDPLYRKKAKKVYPDHVRPETRAAWLEQRKTPAPDSRQVMRCYARKSHGSNRGGTLDLGIKKAKKQWSLFDEVSRTMMKSRGLTRYFSRDFTYSGKAA